MPKVTFKFIASKILRQKLSDSDVKKPRSAACFKFASAEQVKGIEMACSAVVTVFPADRAVAVTERSKRSPVNEAVPVAASAPTTAGTAAAAAVAAAPTTSPVSTSVLPTTAVAPAAAAAPTTAATVATTAAPAPAVAPAPEVTDAATTAAPAVTSVAPPPAAEPTPTEFTGKAHATSGTVRLIPQPDGTTVLRLENLNTSNGPDVKVVLSPDPDGYASGSVTLASLKGNKGSQNYVIPADVDLGSIRSVVLWCKRFNVDFAVAPLPV